MRIGDFQRFEHALDAAVLAPLAVKRIETGIGLENGKAVGDVAVHVDGRDLIAEAAQARSRRPRRIGAKHRAPKTSRPSGPRYGGTRLSFSGGELTSCGRYADALDLPFEHDPAVREDPLADKLTKLLDVGGGGALIVDEKIAVHFGHMCAAHAKAAAASRVDQLPGAVAWRVFEG